MSDDNDTGGIIGSIISILILAVIWPYLLAILGLYIAYLVVLAILEWISQNPLIVVLILLGMTLVFVILRNRLIPKAWRWMTMQFQTKTKEAECSQDEFKSAIPDVADRRFVPSTNLYCYWCTKKLGIDSQERGGKYYCRSCAGRLS
jgi:hypothetical protein